MVDAQPWWLIERLYHVARAYSEVAEIQMERERAKAERQSRT